MKNSLLRLTPALACLLAACSKSPAPVDSSTAAQPNPTSLLASPKVTQPTQALRTAPIQPKAEAHADPTVPLEQYADLNRLPAGMALSFIVTAKAPDSLPVDERLDRLSPAFHAEPDVFKRQEIARAELPHVDAALDEYRRQSYYTLPIANYSTQALALTNITIGPYQPSTRSFPLMSYGNRCWGGVVRNPQGAVLQLDGTGPACSISVPDETIARAIESARANHTLHLSGTAYLFVPQANRGTASGSVAAARIDLSGGSSQASLGRFDLRGS